ncbi:response regulator [Kyrpidia tusciae]|uniref:Transcriptional regulatory protein KdpE n=1 Tax=Kyrpidia tusciae (strain DSM 2912 / NBRC 15312 / T2) TaxID=562970 RepID=D5WU14_KYRT2|nr:response regulator [Kyrpidia tusciae]ADG05334.1 two component transcriptional regulator, winged helix family [Kyrpidia tusciae DSM 2912]
MAGGARIVIVDDEPQIRKFLRVSLRAHGYETLEAETGEDGLRQVTAGKPDLVILDLGLPDMRGADVLRAIREWSSVPVIILSVQEQEEEKIRALDAGADDYITKPFGMGELLARIRVALRHSAKASGDPVIKLGTLRIDLGTREVTVGGQAVKLTPTEYELLKALASHPGRVMTHRQLLKAVWGSGYEQDIHSLRVYIGQLRRKIEEDPARPRWIVTEPGVGYRLRLPHEETSVEE